MHLAKQRIRSCWTYVCCVSLLFLGLTACANLKAQRVNTDVVPVNVIGVQHMGPDFNVAEFYIDNAGGANISREGGGGKSVCCVALPRKWHPGMTAVVRWWVNDWRPKEIKAQDIRGGAFKATVPIEKYDTPDDIYVHFFPGGKVRVITSNLDVLHPDYPILYGPHDDATATVGVPVQELFTKEELLQKRTGNTQ